MDKREPQIFNRRAANEASAQAERGYLFLLRNTHPGTNEARVRQIPLAIITQVAGLSSDMQSQLLGLLRDIAGGESFIAKDWAELTKNQARQIDLADALVEEGFLDPKVYPTVMQADAAINRGENAVSIDEIDPRDRIAYLYSIILPDGEAAKRMRPFPAERLGSRGTGQTVPVPEAAEPRTAFEARVRVESEAVPAV